MTERWRVGTLSLGLSFLTSGIFLLIAQLTGKDASGFFQFWWPIVFLFLGLEILAFLFVSKQGRAVIRYDLFGLFIVGMMGFAGLILLFLSSTGLMQEIRQSLTLVEAEREISPLERQVPAEVSRIVLQNPAGSSIRLEKGKTESLHVFGTCTAWSLPEEAGKALRAEEIVSVRNIGDTMYVTVRGIPEKRGFVHRHSQLYLTVVVPEKVKVDPDSDSGMQAEMASPRQPVRTS